MPNIEPIYGELPDEWLMTNIDMLVSEGIAELQTGPFGTMLRASEYQPIGTPVVAVKHIGDNALVHNELPRIDGEAFRRLSRYQLQAGDIVFGRKGAVDRRALVRHREAGWIQGSDCIRLRFLGASIEPKFISYVLGTTQYKSWIIGNSQGATMPSLNQEIIGRIPIPLPPIEEQHAIAHILGSLDDKIELNRQMNRTLEEIARALFKSWFVDFDPVHAKAAGEQPVGMDAVTAALFPSAFEDSELGPIPAGWTVGPLGDKFNILMGQSPPGSTYNEVGDGVLFFQGRRDFGDRYPGKRVFCTAPTRLASAGDTLVSVRAPVGAINMAAETLCIGRGLAAVRHNSGSRSYTYYSMMALDDAFSRFEGEGTVFGSINQRDFNGLITIQPPDSIVELFEEMAGPLDSLIETNSSKSSTLTDVRDTLLPKLMSGELRVLNMDDLDGE